jgi:hypothetical protein
VLKLLIGRNAYINRSSPHSQGDQNCSSYDPHLLPRTAQGPRWALLRMHSAFGLCKRTSRQVSVPRRQNDLCQLCYPLLQARYAGKDPRRDEIRRSADAVPTPYPGAASPAGWPAKEVSPVGARERQNRMKEGTAGRARGGPAGATDQLFYGVKKV